MVLTRIQEIERSIIKTYRSELWAKFCKALDDFEMLSEGDKVGVCISGGKDSMLLAKLFQELQRHSNIKFELEFIVMNPGYNNKNLELIQKNLEILEIPAKFFESNIFEVANNQEKNPCYLCARMRRGCLYKYAKSLGCNKIALGHHFDDVIETILMGMLYGSQIQTMMPKLHSENYDGMELIRPLYMVRERDIIRWANYNDLSFLQCACRFTERAETEGYETLSKRREVKALIETLRKENSNVEMSIFRSVQNVNLRTLIGYHRDGVKYSFLDDYSNE